MRAVLVGSASARSRLRPQLDAAAIEVVGEVATLAEARATTGGADLADLADAFIVAPDRSAAGDPLPEPLTPRELDVLGLVAEGLPNKAIAARLGISDQTVKFHVASITGKLSAANRTEAVRIALRRGLLTF
jgi:DNA-binding NarL/FixJ family response regulator